MNRLVNLFSKGDQSNSTTPQHSTQSQPQQTPSKSSSWWPFNRQQNQTNSSSKSQSTSKSSQSSRLNGTFPQDENYETIVFKLPPTDPKLKPDIQIKRIRRFARFLSNVDIQTLAQQTWLGCPNPYRALVWSYLLGYLTITPNTTSPQQQKRLISLQRKRTEYAKSILTSYYIPKHHLTQEYQYPLYKRQVEHPELYTQPPVQNENNGIDRNNGHINQNVQNNFNQQTSSNTNNSTNQFNTNSNAINIDINSTISHPEQPLSPNNQNQNLTQQQQQRFTPFSFDPLQPLSLFPSTDLFSTQTQPTNLSSPTNNLPINPLQQQISQADRQLLHQIRIDLPRTLTSYQVIQLPQIQSMLERVLYTWSIRHPAASYVQGMNDLAAMITSIILEQAIWSRVGFSNGYLDVHYYKEDIINPLLSANLPPVPTGPDLSSQTNTILSQTSTARIKSTEHQHDINSNQQKPHIINQNQDMFQMYLCEAPINNFSQAFFDIHLHHQSFSWLFYLSELASKALELVNTPDDRLLHNYTSNFYKVNPTTNTQTTTNNSNIPTQNTTINNKATPTSTPQTKPMVNTNQPSQISNDILTLNIDDFTEGDETITEILQNQQQNDATTIHSSRPTTPTRTSLNSSQTNPTDFPHTDFTYVNDDEGNLNQQQHDFIQKAQQIQFQRVPELYQPSKQHIFDQPVTFDTVKPTSTQDRDVRQIGKIPALDLSRLVPLYKRITTTYWSRDLRSGQHVPNVPKSPQHNCQHKSHEQNNNNKMNDNNTYDIHEFNLGDGSNMDNLPEGPEGQCDQNDQLIQNVDDFTSDFNSFEMISKPSNSQPNSRQTTPKMVPKQFNENNTNKDLSIDINLTDNNGSNNAETPLHSHQSSRSHSQTPSKQSQQQDNNNNNINSSTLAPLPSPSMNTNLNQNNTNGTTRSYQQQLGIPTTTLTHSISPQTAIATLSHLLCPITIATIECDVYWLFTLLIDIVQDNYINKQPGIHRMLSKFESLFTRADPNLASWLFQKNHLFPIQFAFRWFNCLFVRELPFQYSTRLWDVALSNLYIKQSHPQQLQQQHNNNNNITHTSTTNLHSQTNQVLAGNNNNPNAHIIGSLSTSLDYHSTQTTTTTHHGDDNNNDNYGFQLISSSVPHMDVNHHYNDHLTVGTPATSTTSHLMYSPHNQQHDQTSSTTTFQNKRADIDIEAFEDCFVYFAVSVLTFFRRIFFAGKFSPNINHDDEYDNEHDHDDHNDHMNNGGGYWIQSNDNNNKDKSNFTPIDFDDIYDDQPIEILDTPSIYHYHLAGVPFSHLTTTNSWNPCQNDDATNNGNNNSLLSSSSSNTGNNNKKSQNNNNGILGFNLNSNQQEKRNYSTNDTSIIFSNNYYPSILYLPKQFIHNNPFMSNKNKDNHHNNNDYNESKLNDSNSILSPHSNTKDNKDKTASTKEIDTIYSEHICPESLHSMQQELLYNNIYRHHSDCVHNHQYDKNTQNITISLQYIDPITHSAITILTKPDQTSTTSTTQISMIGTSTNVIKTGNNGNNNNKNNDSISASILKLQQQQQQLSSNTSSLIPLSPHGIAILNNAAYLELNLPQKWLLDNFGDIIIFLQQHIPTITTSLWVNEDLETCLSKMYLLQHTYSYQLPNNGHNNHHE